MSNEKPVDRSTFLDQIGFGFAEDGRIVELHLIWKNGKQHMFRLNLMISRMLSSAYNRR